jgi:uncharacterized protein
MIKPTLLVSKHKNHYVYSPWVNQFLLIHPVLGFYLRLEIRGVKPKKWLKEFPSHILMIEGVGAFDRDQMTYYLRKYLFLNRFGYFREVDFSKKLDAQLTSTDIERFLTQSSHMTFEVTAACNLRCKYCGFGDLYVKQKSRAITVMSPMLSSRFIDFLFSLKRGHGTASYVKNFRLGFYGGEPMLNMSLIKAIIRYLKRQLGDQEDLSVQMTTNGTLISDYAEYLIANEFILTVSLDGNQDNQSYRRFHSGDPSYPIVYKNLVELKERNPEYFAKNVHFVSVLHDRNSNIAQLKTYFDDHFGKPTSILELSTSGVAEDKRSEWTLMLRSRVAESRKLSEDEKSQLGVDPVESRVARILRRKSGFVFQGFNELLAPAVTSLFPGATCLPFSRRIYLTADGRILPCERVDYKYSLGQVEEKDVRIDFGTIATKYNSGYEKLRALCDGCYRTLDCTECMFQLPLDDQFPRCPSFAGYDAHERELSFAFSYFETNATLHTKIINEITVI